MSNDIIRNKFQAETEDVHYMMYRRHNCSFFVGFGFSVSELAKILAVSQATVNRRHSARKVVKWYGET